MDDFRKIFDTISDEFDRWRPRYCAALFDDIIAYAQLGPGKAVLEIGPGTGQATGPILRIGCDYMAIELGENMTRAMKEKFGHYENFSIVNADFETHDFGGQTFDLVYSAAAFQWIPEGVGFPKAFELLKRGGKLALFACWGDEKSAGEALYAKIQEVYAAHFHPETEYTCSLAYENAVKYGFVDFESRTYTGERHFTADEYVGLTATHAPHITLPEPHRARFFEGIRQAVLEAGDRMTIRDTYALRLAGKP